MGKYGPQKTGFGQFSLIASVTFLLKSILNQDIFIAAVGNNYFLEKNI